MTSEEVLVVFDSLVAGHRRSPADAALSQRVTFELLSTRIPIAVDALKNGRGTIHPELQNLKDAAELAADVSGWIDQFGQTPARTPATAVSVFPSPKIIFDQPEERYISTEEVLSLYRRYISLDCASATLERLFVCAVVEQQVRTEAAQFGRFLSNDQHPPADNSLFGMLTSALVGAAMISAAVAFVWGWLTLGDRYGAEYLAGWVIGQAFLIFLVLGALAGFGASQIWASEVRHQLDRSEKARTFKSSALIVLYQEARTATQSRLLSLAKAAEAGGRALHDPVLALLNRAAARSPDDWIA